MLKRFPCGHRRIKSNLTGRGDCRRCVLIRVDTWQKSHPESVRARNIACRLRNPRRYWERKRKWKHGPNAVEHYEEQKKKQKNLCPICLKNSTLVQDHSHACCPRSRYGRSCGKCLRGLLCNYCNRKLGTLEPLFLLNPKLVLPDNQWMKRAYQYVFEWERRFNRLLKSQEKKE